VLNATTNSQHVMVREAWYTRWWYRVSLLRIVLFSSVFLHFRPT